MDKPKRKGFNFYISYFDVYNELEDKDKLAFIDALLNREFYGVEPTKLKGMAKFAYISQQHSIDSQVKGFEDKTRTKLSPPSVGVSNTPKLQVEEEEEEEVEYTNTIFDKEGKFLSLFNNLKEKKTGKESRFKTLSPADQKNFKKLQSHTVGDFTTVINTMLEADWPKQTNNQTPSHVLRVENFNRYLSNPIKTTVEETDEERAVRLLEETKNQ